MFSDVEQNTPEWFQMRVGRITGSKMAAVMAYHDAAKHKWGDGANEYALCKANERLTGRRNTASDFTSYDMSRGTELEPRARDEYEKATFYKVSPGGFHALGDHVGTSPDGLVGEDGCIEIKCPKENTHLKIIDKGGYDTKYRWQMNAHMWLANRKWVDFVSYNPDVVESSRLHIFRLYRDEELIEKMRIRCELFDLLVKEKMKKL